MGRRPVSRAGSAVSWQIGPWFGVKSTPDPFDANPKDQAYRAFNMYCPEPGSAGMDTRPAWLTTNDGAQQGSGGTRYGQCVVEHVDSSGVIRSFSFVGGKVYRWNRTIASSSWTDVTPTGVTITTGAVPIFATPFGDALLINDQVNTPWAMTSLGSTPCIGATVVYDASSGTVTLSRSGNFNINYPAFQYTISGVSYTVVTGNKAIAGTITIGNWSSWKLSVDTSGVFTATQGTTNQASEAAAISGLAATPGGQFFVGYITVQANSGNNFTGGTDALTGGTGGAIAQTTNYYGGSMTTWLANGQWATWNARPVIVVASDTTGTKMGNQITWGEVNSYALGFQQTNYDNNWALTQVDSDTIYGLAATENWLAAFRENAITFISGQTTGNFRTNSTREGIEGLGSTSARSLEIWNNSVYFVNALGQPHQIGADKSINPLWLQMRGVAEAFTAAQIAGLNVTAKTVVYKALSLVLFSIVTAPGASPQSIYTFHLQTGLYGDFWTLPTTTDTVDIFGVCRDTSLVPHLLVVGQAGAASGYVYRLTQLAEATNRDVVLGVTTGIAWSLTADFLYLDQSTGIFLTECSALTNAATIISRLIVTPYGNSATLDATPASPTGVTMYRAVWGSEVQGDFLQIALSGTTVAGQQTKIYQIQAKGRAIAINPTAA